MKKLFTILFFTLIVSNIFATVGTFTITTASVPASHTKHTYTKKIVCTGGVAPYTWIVSSGTLPNGLGLQSNNGTIGGIISLRGDTSIVFSIRATDSSVPSYTCTTTYTLVNTDYDIPRSTMAQTLTNYWTRTNLPPTYGETYDTWNNLITNNIQINAGANITVTGTSPTYTITGSSGGGGEVISFKKVHLTASQLKTSQSSPVNCGITNPGVGKFINVISSNIQVNQGDTAFYGNGESVGKLFLFYNINKRSFESVVNLGDVSLSSSFIQQMIPYRSSPIGLVSNSLLYLGVADNFTDGNGSVDVYITYQIITL